MQRPDSDSTNADGPARAAQITIGTLFRARACCHPERIAIEDARRSLDYARLDERVCQLANVLAHAGLKRGDRIAVLSENRVEYLEITLAAALLGIIVCAQNWRLKPNELLHCIELTRPAVLFVSRRHRELLAGIDHGVPRIIEIERDYETLLTRASSGAPAIVAQPEDGLTILYTSGTTGLPKGALVSHRALVARIHSNFADLELAGGDTFVAWPPLFHMASMDQSLAVLCSGGRVIVVDGFEVERLVDIAMKQRLWWLLLMPGTVDRFCIELTRRGRPVAGMKLVGAMADLVPRHQIAELTRLVGAPFVNSFGSTETGPPPATAGRFGIGEAPLDLAKTQSSLCDVRLVDADDKEVEDGMPGELTFRGPTLFSGYWNAPETNSRDFRGGWFHMGDVFVRNPDRSLSFVDRVKYMIKSGGENIYPAEIEQVLLAAPGVEEAVVVRQPDDRWGEVPIAMVARSDPNLSEADLLERCAQVLAGYKRPREIRFMELERFPRSTTGKVQRHELERWLTRR
ncbi:MAG: AMP-binding protein [Gammaproteobacteria bacterium]|nr:AMP-binding protein [Gammaproteobacteria bacterium]